MHRFNILYSLRYLLPSQSVHADILEPVPPAVLFVTGTVRHR